MNSLGSFTRHQAAGSAGLTRRIRTTVVRARATILVLVAIWLIGLAALAAVMSFQGRVDDERRAQVVVGTIQGEMRDLTLVVFKPVLLGGAGSKGVQPDPALIGAKQTIRESLSVLSTLVSRSEAAHIDALSRGFFKSIDHLVVLVARGPALRAVLELGRDQAPDGQYGALFDELHQAAIAHGGNADRWRLIGSVGTIAAIGFMLVAFSLTLYRATRLSSEKQQLLERSQVEALTDALTGLPNRRKLFVDIEGLLRDSPREPIALGVFDLDGFKEYNDTFGHPAGDDLLARLGQNLAAVVAGRGTAYRMGGDEFCVIARGRDGERVLEAAKEALCEHGEFYSVSCSHGRVVVAPDGGTIEQALLQADQRLYDNKRSSRAREDAEGNELLLRILADTGSRSPGN